MYATITAIIAYLGVSSSLLAQQKGLQSNKALLPSLLMAVGVAAHAVSANQMIVTGTGLHLGFFHVSSLIFWVICLHGLFSFITHKPVRNLLILIFPLAALSLTCALLFQAPYTPRHDLAPGVALHIILSVLASATFTIAAIQALLLATLVRQLKHRQTSGLIDALPPLQTMEQLLFELLWAGITLLSASIIVGFIFVDDLFAQHLAHKTVFSLIAWVVFAGLLVGRHRFGWRGKTAVRWTLGGVTLLMLGFFGSKLVLELILAA